jgi:predicted transposase YbfD/YdcC
VPVGFSKGFRRHRADYYQPGERPKRLWMKELVPNARAKLRAAQLPEHCRDGLVDAPHGLLPLPDVAQRSLMETFWRAKDHRARNTRFRIGPVLCIVAMALLAGCRQISEIARFATRLTPKQRARLRLPRKKDTKAFYEVPSYSVFYDVLTRLDPNEFARLLSGWLNQNQGILPSALALDGKMIRDIIGTVSLVDAQDGSPVAVAVIDQKEKTERCELKVAQQILRQMPTLVGKTVTADPLHCQKQTAAIIMEKGGEYFLQVKANQSKLHKHAQKQCPDTPLLPRRQPATDASKNAR